MKKSNLGYESKVRRETRGVYHTTWHLSLGAVCVSEDFSYPLENTYCALSSTQIGTILSVNSSGFKGVGFTTGPLDQGYICVARQYGPAYRGKGYKTPEQEKRERVVLL